MKKWDLSKIMQRAWQLFRKYQITFAEALHRAWMAAKAVAINAERIERARQAAGIEEETNTWSAWKQRGFEVVHGQKALFKTVLIWASRGDNEHYIGSFFGRSQVQPILEGGAE